jgi:hypothetical protein
MSEWEADLAELTKRARDAARHDQKEASQLLLTLAKRVDALSGLLSTYGATKWRLRTALQGLTDAIEKGDPAWSNLTKHPAFLEASVELSGVNDDL